MNLLDIRSVVAIAALALLSACGGSSPEAADTAPAPAALAVSANAPVADCEAEGCNRPRIIDGLAEQYRNDAAAQQARAAEPAPAPAPPTQAGVSAAEPALPVPPAAAAAQ
jgi:hypothetical protein